MRAVLAIVGITASSVLVMGSFSCGGESEPIADTSDGGDGAASSSSGGPREAGANGVTADGGINSEAGPGGDTTQLPCGTASCLIPTESCCVSEVNNGRSYACVAGSTCPSTQGDTAALKCSGTANCAAGNVCCVTSNNDVTTSECKPSCTPDGGGGGADTAQLCDPAKGDAAGCPANQPCSNNDIGDWGLPRSFGTCGGRGR